MSKDINRVCLIGRLTRDPDLRYTNTGVEVTSFTIANNNSYTKNGNKVEQVSYFNCVSWNKLANIIAEYCIKGQQVAIDGRLQQRTWQDKDGNNRSTVEITVESLEMLSKPGQSTERNISNDKNNNDQGNVQTGFYDLPESNPFSDDDIPF